MGGVTDEINKHYRVYSDAGFKVKGATSIIRECLRPFPYIWVSIVRVFICGRCLIMLDIAQLLVCEVCECQTLLTLFISTEQTMLCSAL